MAESVGVFVQHDAIDEEGSSKDFDIEDLFRKPKQAEGGEEQEEKAAAGEGAKEGQKVAVEEGELVAVEKEGAASEKREEAAKASKEADAQPPTTDGAGGKGTVAIEA